MNHLLAKLRGKDEYKKILSDQTIYQRPLDLEGKKEYEAGYSLEDDEWFALDQFSEREFCIPLLSKPFRSTDYSPLKVVAPQDIEYICSYQNETDYYFQRIMKYCLLKKRCLMLGDDIRVEDTSSSIILNEVPDALYIKSEDCLYFKKLETIAPIFPGADSLYRAATDQETEDFFKNEFVESVGPYQADKVKKANRKRIAMVMDALKNFDANQRKKVLNYTHRYYPKLPYHKGRFQVASEEDLKFLLWGIEQRYYTTPVTKEKRVANSVSRLVL